MRKLALFTDVSLNPKEKIGIGGYLLVPVSFLERVPDSIEQSEVSERLKIRSFADTSSTMLEVQTVLWALENVREEATVCADRSLQIYTDSQCVAGLLGRRAALESTCFVAKRSRRQLPNAALYRSFYAEYDRLSFQLIKVAGHSPAGSHDTVHRIFSYLDREVRKALQDQLQS